MNAPMIAPVCVDISNVSITGELSAAFSRTKAAHVLIIADTCSTPTTQDTSLDMIEVSFDERNSAADMNARKMP
jgi:orotate phosphoribosyltransferase-like protein